MMKITENNWVCVICGSCSMDSDERNRTLKDHLRKQHELDLNNYETIVNKGIGLSKLKVKLLNYPNEIKQTIVSFLSQTWGPTFDLNEYTTDEVNEMIKMSLNGKTLSTVLESMNFTFQIDGLSRASSHQLVRVRIGSGFSQKGMSDAYYGDSPYIIPASIYAFGFLDEYTKCMDETYTLYNKMFESGITYQDARFILPHSVSTSLVWTVNFLALKNFCSKRLQRTQSWEMNGLCNLIKIELEKIYPELSKSLVPVCDISKKCCSFGNLFEGCGKYSLEKKHNRYVFESSQIMRNLKFNTTYNSISMIHNKTVKPVNNHFLLTAQENLLKKEVRFGKYANEIYCKIYEIKSDFNYSIDELSTVISNFDYLYSKYDKFEKNNDAVLEEEILTYISVSKNILFNAIHDALNMDLQQIKDFSWDLHQTKNIKYNDGWYFDGKRGVLKDLHRKIQRLRTAINNNKIKELNLNDYCDTLIYFIFLEVSIEKGISYCGK